MPLNTRVLLIFFTVSLPAWTLPLVGPAMAADQPPLQKKQTEELTDSTRTAAEYFRTAQFEQERKARRDAIEFIKKRQGLKYPEIEPQKSYLESVKRVMSLSEKEQERISEARRHIMQADDLHFRTYQGDAACIAEYKAALDIYIDVMGPEDGVVADLQYRIGAALQRFGRSREAVPFLQDAAKSKARAQGEIHAGGPLNILCLALMDIGRYKDAECEALKAARLAAAGWGDGSSRHAAVLFNVALIRRKAGKYEAAVAAFVDAESRFAASDDGNAPRAIQCRFGRAKTLVLMGRNDEAIVVYEQAIKDAEALPRGAVPEMPLSLSRAYKDYASTLQAVGEHSKADQALKQAEALQLREKKSHENALEGPAVR